MPHNYRGLQLKEYSLMLISQRAMLIMCVINSATVDMPLLVVYDLLAISWGIAPWLVLPLIFTKLCARYSCKPVNSYLSCTLHKYSKMFSPSNKDLVCILLIKPFNLISSIMSEGVCNNLKIIYVPHPCLPLLYDC